jgi:antitoxin HigA-1
MTNGGSALSGPKARPVRSTSRLSITTRRHHGTYPIHPGEHLAQELKELSISAAELARQIDVTVNRVTGIINGQRAITADTALRLGHWFGTSSEFWLNLQKLYELRLAREEVGDRVEKLPSSRNASAARPGEPRNSCTGAPLTTASDEFFVPLCRAEREAHDCEDEAAWWKASRFLKGRAGFLFRDLCSQARVPSNVAARSSYCG